MKLVFPNNEHNDIELQGNKFTIGKSNNADIQINAIGMSDLHATLIKDEQDFFLTIDNPAAMASVNGRLVKESKEVRVGDLMIIAQVHCKIVSGSESSSEAAADDDRTRIRMALPKFVLRGVSGEYFGKTFPLRGKTSIGRHSDNDIFVNVDGISRKHAAISIIEGGIEVEDLGSSNGTFVNGKKITKIALNVGDEVKLDNIRFLIQSTGMPAKDATNDSKTSSSVAKQSATQKIETGNISGFKWAVTILVLLAAIAATAWYLGFLDKFIN